MIYGPPPVRIEDDQTDRVGLRTLTMSQLWQAPRWPMTDAEMDEVAPAPPLEMVGPGMMYIGRQRRPTGGALRDIWTFEGVDGDPNAPTFRTRENTIDYQFDPGFSQVDILLHPRIQDLLTKYGGSIIDGEVQWPATVSTNPNGLSLDEGGQGKANPMFGQKDFRRLEGMYTCRYLALDFGVAGVGAGAIYEGGLPGSAPVYPGRNWLKWPSPYRRRGLIMDITEMYELSGPGGWPRPVYGIGAQR